jgi:hypothetical protein
MKDNIDTLDHLPLYQMGKIETLNCKRKHT